jgi:hypothetical protein
MDTEYTEPQLIQISSQKLFALVRTLIGASAGREDDEHPLPPGPWDPVIRVALERSSVFGPQPEPWKVVISSILARHPEIWDAIGGGHGLGDEVALNPQPLPPRITFLMSVAQAVVDRAELLQELAGAAQREGEDRGIIIVSGYIARFVEDFCGNGFKLKYPFPGPRPHWFNNELDGIDLVVLAMQFDQAAKEAYNPNLRLNLVDASLKFVEAGLSMME